MKKPLIILTGPTAVGKTKLSIALAKTVNGEIISADSMQIYRHMDIGTAKIRPEEMEGIRHYLVDELEPDEEFHVVEFQERAEQAMKLIYEKGKIPILTGGTGFYIQAVVNQIDFTSTRENLPYRKQLQELAGTRGKEYLHRMLEQVDPEAAGMIHQNNVKKVIRALEFYMETGMPISQHNREQAAKESPYNLAYFVLNRSRETLYRRIDQRVDAMMEEGLLEEVSKLKEMGYNKKMVSMQGLGYKEILDYLDGYTTLEEAVSIIKRDTRHFAKRQLTWFKREKDAIWMNWEDYGSDADMLEHMLVILRQRHICR